MKRWAEHFDGVLNRPSSINDKAIHGLPQVEYNPLLDKFPTISETVKVIKLLSSSKAPESDAIPVEIYKAGDPPVAENRVVSHHMDKRSHPSRIFKSVTIIKASLFVNCCEDPLQDSY